MKNKIKRDMITAMKEKDTVTRDILRVVTGEIQRNEQSSKGKIELTDAEVIKIIQKMVDTAETPEDATVLEAYLPKQMSEADMCQIVVSHSAVKGYNSPKDMGKLMAHFKENYAGTYDGRVLSGIVKEILIKNK